MSVYASIATIFIENLVAIAGLLAAGFMVSEYVRGHRSKGLLLFAAAFFVFGAGFLVTFLGQLTFLYFRSGIGGSIILSGKFFTLAAACLMIAGTAYAYRFRHARVWAVVAVLAFAASVIAAGRDPGPLAFASGLPFERVNTLGFVTTFLPWIVAIALLTFTSGASYFKGRRTHQQFILADLCIFRAGLVGILALVVSFALISLDLSEFVWANFVLVLAQLIILFVGASAKDHPQEVVARNPHNIVGRSLALKALAVNTALFWLLAFFLVSITTSYFSSSLLTARGEVMRRDLGLLVTSYQTVSGHLLEDVRLYAEHPFVIRAVMDGSGDTVGLERMMGENAGRDVYIFGADGSVVYGTDAGDASFLKGSTILKRALSGESVVGIEREPSIGNWYFRAGAPVIGDDGRIAGVIISSDAVLALNLENYAPFTISKATGYGFVAASGEPVFIAGEDIDALTRNEFGRRHSDGEIIEGTRLNGDMFYVVDVHRSNGDEDGYFYIYVTTRTLQTEMLSILSVVMVFVTLFVMIVAAVLVFSMLVVLRPVRELKEAAERIGHGDFDLHIGYDKPDEIGDLAAAFNKMSATIKERTTRLDEAIRQQRDFLTHTAHEMRTPLNIFRWSLEMLRFGDTGKLNTEQLELIEQMHQTNERIRKLVMNLLDASRIDKGKLELRREFTQTEDVVDDVAGALAVRIREKNIYLHWNRPEQTLPKTYADRDRLYQVLLNLLSNAVKYTHRNGHIEVLLKEVESSGPSGKEGRYLQISVEDNGRGIPKNQQAKVFTRFFRASNVVTEEIEGTGLGLYITKKLVEMHGGELWFESMEGEGSTFTFTIPTRKP